MGLFGWSLPPGVSRLPGEEDHVCEICWHGEDDCICSPCGVCGEVGRSKCCQEHGMVLTQAQIESAKKAEEFYSQKAADEYHAEIEMDKAAEEYWKNELANGEESGKL